MVNNLKFLIFANNLLRLMTYKELEDCKVNLSDNQFYWVRIKNARWQPAMWLKSREVMKLINGGYKSVSDLQDIDTRELNYSCKQII